MAFVSSAFERKIIPLRDERGALFIRDRNYGHHEIISPTPRPIQENFAEQARLLERNFQNMLENRLSGERPDRHPAAGTWERTSPRFRRDRSRRDACPTVRPRCFGVRPGFSGSEIAEQLQPGFGLLHSG